MHALKSFFTNKNILVSAGATYENIDPVRFVGNKSSGKMGIAIANALALLEANVFLIKGHTEPLISIHQKIKIIEALTAKEMLEACQMNFPFMDITLMAAAVADYSPLSIATQKIKKQGEELILRLKKNTDILTLLGSQKKINQYLVGFALETENGINNAKEKMMKKNCDMMILNMLDKNNPVFGSDNNSISVLCGNNQMTTYEQESKQALAKKIISLIQKELT